MSDYPAAHSMDTTWFAIDNDGNVAVFETGESGCVPEGAYTDDGYTMQGEISALPPKGFKFDPDGFGESQYSTHVEVDDIPEGAEGLELFMFLSDLVPVNDLLARLNSEQIGSSKGQAVRLRATDRSAFAELHAREACNGCYRDWSEGGGNEIASHGAYRYEHTCENWIAGPYARATIPNQPLTIEEIPKSIRDKAIAFDGRFADTLKLQPAEHWSCTSWESGWLSADGKTARPFTDSDGWEDYAEQRSDIGDDDGGIKFVNEPLELAKPPKKRWWK
jgi:hypothetical protein